MERNHELNELGELYHCTCPPITTRLYSPSVTLHCAGAELCLHVSIRARAVSHTARHVAARVASATICTAWHSSVSCRSGETGRCIWAREANQGLPSMVCELLLAVRSRPSIGSCDAPHAVHMDSSVCLSNGTPCMVKGHPPAENLVVRSK